jgi:hypothetical protein
VGARRAIYQIPCSNYAEAFHTSNKKKRAARKLLRTNLIKGHRILRQKQWYNSTKNNSINSSISDMRATQKGESVPRRWEIFTFQKQAQMFHPHQEVNKAFSSW